MSHLISNCHYNSDSIIKVPTKEVIIPKFKNILQPKTFTKKKDTNMVIQELAMIRMVKKLTCQQIEKIQAENSRIFMKKFLELKKNMRKQSVGNYNYPEIDNLFKQKDKRVGLIHNAIQNEDETVEIEKKYHTKLRNKRSIIQETLQIEQSKKNYTQWFDSLHNNPLNSPNFRFMNSIMRRSYQNKQAFIQFLPNNNRTILLMRDTKSSQKRRVFSKIK